MVPGAGLPTVFPFGRTAGLARPFTHTLGVGLSGAEDGLWGAGEPPTTQGPSTDPLRTFGWENTSPVRPGPSV